MWIRVCCFDGMVMRWLLSVVADVYVCIKAKWCEGVFFICLSEGVCM